MQIQAPFCLLILACSFLEINKRFWVYFLRLLIMDCAPFLKSLTQNSDFGCGFFVIGCSPHAFKIGGLLLVFYLGLKLLQFGFHRRGLVQCFCGISGKSSDKSNGLCSKIDFGEVCDVKIVSCNCGGPLMFLGNSKLINLEKKIKIEGKDIDDDDDDDDERECCNEDQQFDLKELRKMVKTQKQRASVTLMELEKERMAAASAANEAMAMILRLQSEKSAIEIEANHYRRMAEEKQDYDKEVIQSLQWIIKNHESERCQLESKLKLCRQKVKQYVMVDDDDDDDDDEEFVSSLDPSFSIHDEFVSSLDMDSTEW